MFDTVCTLPLTSDLFSQAVHPSAPVLATGLASGHVSVYRLPSLGDTDSSDDEQHSHIHAHPDGRGQIATAWRTRRHDLSCRALAFTSDGEHLLSAGADGMVKYASATTGRVVDKLLVPVDEVDGGIDAPCLLHALGPQTLLLATDSAALHLYDLRVGSGAGFAKRRPQQTHRPHVDYISSLTPLPPTQHSTSGLSKQWVTTGGTTLAVTDLRRGVLVRSEDQDEVLLSSVAVSGLSKRGTSVGEKIVVGGGAGVLTLWERGQWDDQDERIVVDRGFNNAQGGESLDSLTLLPPDSVRSSGSPTIAVGMGDGRVRFVALGPNKVVGQIRHDDVEGVVAIACDVEGRLITAGGNTIKVWHPLVDEDNGAYVDEGSRPNKRFTIYDDDDKPVDQQQQQQQQQEELAGPQQQIDAGRNPNGSRHLDSDEDTDSDNDDDEGHRRKKQKPPPGKAKGKGGHLNGVAGNFSFAGLD